MKKIFLALIFTIFGAVIGILAFSGSASSVQEYQILKWQPIEEGVDRQSVAAAGRYFYSCLSEDENGHFVYPDTFGGCYLNDDGNLLIQVTTSDLSEYLFLQEEFPCIVFEQVKYSRNYLEGLIDEYLGAYDPNTETVYGGYVETSINRAIIGVDKETLSRKTNDPDSPIIFEEGFFSVNFDDYSENSNDNEPYGIHNSSVVSQQKTINNIMGGETLENRGFMGNSHKGYFSAGIGCTISSGENGLVANGHGMAIGDFIYSNDTLIGMVLSVQFDSGDGDYSIIGLLNNVTANGETHYINDVTRCNHSVYDPDIGDKLFKSTQIKGYADLEVLERDVPSKQVVDGKQVEISGLVKAKVTRGYAGSGDSGAGVYHNHNNNSLSFLEFSGIIHGGKYDEKDGLVVVFTPPKHIHNCTIVCV